MTDRLTPFRLTPEREAEIRDYLQPSVATDTHGDQCARELLLELDALRQTTWQPIATAPNHETVFVYLPNYGVISANRTDRDWWARISSEIVYPTHWMPLPDPPSAARLAPTGGT